MSLMKKVSYLTIYLLFKNKYIYIYIKTESSVSTYILSITKPTNQIVQLVGRVQWCHRSPIILRGLSFQSIFGYLVQLLVQVKNQNTPSPKLKQETKGEKNLIALQKYGRQPERKMQQHKTVFCEQHLAIPAPYMQLAVSNAELLIQRILPWYFDRG